MGSQRFGDGRGGEAGKDGEARGNLRRRVTGLTVLTLLTGLSSALLFGAKLPRIPPLPANRFPDAGTAEPFARALIRQMPPVELARTLAADPDLVPPVLRNLGTAALTNDQVGTYMRNVVRASADADVQHIVTLIVLDPLRYGEDPSFRKRIDRWAPGTIATLPQAKARAVIEELTRSAALDYDTAERAAVAAHLLPRTSASQRIPFDAASTRMPDDIAPIEASIFSLRSDFFTDDEIRTFLDAVHAMAPRRRIIALGANSELRAALPHRSRATLGMTVVPTFGRAFTPWARDPFIAARTAAGRIIFINRPNAQPHREEDQNMTRALVAGLPSPAAWTVAPVPFHNGHILLTPSTVWISMHTVEPRARALFGSGDPHSDARRYFDCVERAAYELQQFYRRPVRFVHPLAPDMLDALIGGAGFDLDSIVTILPHAALVGDIHAGTIAAGRATAAEWSVVQRAYRLRGTVDDYVTAQQLPKTVALQAFLDIVAAELKHDGFTVRRLPLLDIPTAFVAREDVPQDSDFPITWNNVVLEGDRAEGFASLLGSIDDEVRDTFAKSGYKLTLLPPLTHSIVLGGGYRCASNHIRSSVGNSRYRPSPTGN